MSVFNRKADFVGQTPVFLYDLSFIGKQYNSLKNNTSADIFYAVKANFEPRIIEKLVKLGSGFDCVSIGEIKHVINLGANAGNIIFSGVGKTSEEISFAINSQIKQISAESIEEIRDIIEIARKENRVANLGLRVNLDVDVDTHKYISTGSKSTKFGISYESIDEILRIIKDEKYINFVGLSVHIGSQILSIDNFKKAFDKFSIIIKEISQKGHALKWVSLGGGFGVPYHPDQDLGYHNLQSEYISTVNAFQANTGLKVLLEPGRFLVANSCIAIAKITRIKKTADADFMILDMGMNNIIRPALYQAYHHITPLKNDENRKIQSYKIVGPICESADVFHEQFQMQEMFKDEYVIIHSVGAYCASMASNYNLMPIAAAIFED